MSRCPVGILGFLEKLAEDPAFETKTVSGMRRFVQNMRAAGWSLPGDNPPQAEDSGGRPAALQQAIDRMTALAGMADLPYRADVLLTPEQAAAVLAALTRSP